MKNIGKRVIPLLLALVLVVGAMLLEVSATTIPAGYTPIYTAQNFSNIRNNPNDQYILMNDIDLKSLGTWLPINNFDGILDGNNFAIRNMTINSSNWGWNSSGGLFVSVDNGEIKNLNIVNASISVFNDFASVGGIAGHIGESAKISNCSFTGSINAEIPCTAYIGGIVGVSEGEISNCYNWGNININCVEPNLSPGIGGVHVGGIAGRAIDISDCYNWGNISASSGRTLAGGIAGIANNNVVRCFNEGNITIISQSGEVSAGGTVGAAELNANANLKIENCINKGEVFAETRIGDMYSGEAYVGGILAGGQGTLTNARSIINCYNEGKITCKSSHKAASAFGITGGYHVTRMENCLNRGEIIAKSLNGNAYVAGIGSQGGDSITNCYNEGELTATGSMYACVAGITLNANTIFNSHNAGNMEAIATSNILGADASASGVVGSAWQVEQCSNRGDLRAISNNRSYINGVGLGTHAVFAPHMIRNSYNTGNAVVQGKEIFYAGISNTTQLKDITFENVYNAGQLEVLGIPDEKTIGGIFCDNRWGANAVFENAYFLDSTATVAFVDYGNITFTLINVKALSDAQMRTQDSFEGFNFDTIWRMPIDGGYPVLQSQEKYFSDTTYPVVVTNGEGSGNYAEGEMVIIHANLPPSGKRFKEWSITPAVTFINDTSKESVTAKFVMPTEPVTVEAIYEDIPPVTFAVTVNGGTGSGEYAVGETVTITLDTVPSGKRFKQWSVSPAVTYAGGTNIMSTIVKFIMPTNNVTVTSILANIYTLTVINGRINGTSINPAEYEAGAYVHIIADTAPSGMQFKEWEFTPTVNLGVSLKTIPYITISMPNHNVTAVAVYEDVHNHTPGEWETTLAATCTAPGERAKKCTDCNVIIETDTISATGHTESDWITTVPPTCTTPGEMIKRCTDCLITLETDIVPAKGHTSGEWEITTAATCTAPGERVKKCTICGTVVDTGTISATGHTPGQWEITKAATCTATGTRAKRCTDCGFTLETETIPATGHTPGQWEATLASTCTATGTNTKKCTVCGEVLETTTTPSTGHSFSAWTKTKESTYDTPGEEQRICSTCNTIEKREIPTLDRPIHTHTPGGWETTQQPTCTTAGTKIKKCTSCGETLETETTPATGHSPSDWNTTKAATCTATGTRVKKCIICNTVVETATIPVTGHTPGQWEITKAATCTATGTRVKKCITCNTVVETGTIPALVHSPGNWGTTRAATCTAPGERVKKCTVCSTVVETGTIPATGHTSGDWEVTKAATENEPGERVEKCSTCGTVLERESIPATGSGTVQPPTVKTIFSTKYESSFLNWILFFIGFGWVWMWF